MLLWYLVYDDLLARFDSHVNLRTIVFTDDLAIMVGNLNLHMRMIINWCDNSDLQIAREKTEILLLTRMRVPRIFNLTLAAKTLITRERAIYLGVMLDTKRNFYDHTEVVRARAGAIVRAIRRLLPNVNGFSNACRKLYYQVWKSVVLYVSPVWVDAPSKTKVEKEVCKAQRNTVTSTSTSYRTGMRRCAC